LWPKIADRAGRYQAKSLSCRQCGSTWTSYEEKETDVNIAVSLVSDAASGAADIAVLLSADSDLCPAIRAIRRLAPSLGMIAVFPPRRQSLEIKALIPGAFQLAQADIRNSLLLTIVVDPVSGQQYKRPAKWY
jgi:NYN domain-containing protein